MSLKSDYEKFLEQAVSTYWEQLQENEKAKEYLAGRQINGKGFFLGYVDNPLPGHERYRGCLCIPYLRYSAGTGRRSCCSIRFRDLNPNAKAKYLTTPGDKPRLFNTEALMADRATIAISEGELDAIAVTEAGVPAVGVPGSSSWKPHFREPFVGYQTVYVLGDGDDAGRKFVSKVCKELSNAKPVLLPEGEDANSLILKEGKGALLSRL